MRRLLNEVERNEMSNMKRLRDIISRMVCREGVSEDISYLKILLPGDNFMQTDL